MRGVVGIDRGIFEHEIFADAPFTEREAWIWMIAEAAWKERTRRVGDYVTKLQRGQLVGSMRFLADKWGWTKSKVERFISRLKTETMIETRTETGISIITVCNYDKYQKVSLPCETQESQQSRQMRDSSETDAGQMRDKTEGNKNNKTINAGPASAASLEADFFRRVKQICGPSAGGLASKLLASKQGDIALARSAIEFAATKENPREWLGRVVKNGSDPPKERADLSW